MPSRVDAEAPVHAEGPPILRMIAIGGALTVLAAHLLWRPVESLFIDGIFSWSVGQAATWQGGLELLTIYVVVAGVVAFVRRPRALAVVVAIPLLLYLRRHHVDLALGASLLYLEGLIGIGAALEKLASGDRPAGLPAYLRWFLAGVAAWAVVIVGASLAGVATPGTLRLLLALVAIPSLAYSRRPPLCVHLFRRFADEDRRHRSIDTFFLVFFAGLFARTNATPDHDSLWYGLRGHLVLAADGSIFDHLGMTAGVYYYPKLFEALLLPLSDLGDFSLVIGLNLAALALLGVAVYQLAREIGISPLWSKGAVALVVTLPAAVGIAVGAKADLFAALLLTLAALHFRRLVATGSWQDGLVGLSAVGMSLVSKLTSLPYGGILVPVTLVLWAGYRRRRVEEEPADRPTGSFSWLVFAGATVTSVAFTLRTTLLAGVPTVIPAGLWKLFGLELREPVGVIVKDRTGEVSSVPSLAHDFILDPDALGHVRITWTGNAWLFLLVAAVLLWIGWRARSGPVVPVAPWLPVIASGFGFALLYNNSLPGGDGNYYIYPLVLMIVLAVRAAAARARPLALLMAVLTVAFVGQQAAISFVTCHWDPGTRPLDLDFLRSPFDTEATRQALIRRNGLDDIAAFLESNPGVERVVGYGPEAVLQWLPARFESLRIMAYFQPNPQADPKKFVHYLHDRRIEFVLLPRLDRTGRMGETLAFLASQPGVDTIDDDLFRLIDLRPIHDRLPELAEEISSPRRSAIHYRLHDLLGGAELRGQAPAAQRWGQRIAPVGTDLLPYTRNGGIIMSAETAARFTLALPDYRRLSFAAQVGIHPDYVVDSRGDGVEVAVVVIPADGRTPLKVQRELLPGQGFVPMELDLARFRGQKVVLVLQVKNAPGADSKNDWVVWVLPRVESIPRAVGRPDPGTAPAAATSGERSSPAPGASRVTWPDGKEQRQVSDGLVPRSAT